MKSTLRLSRRRHDVSRRRVLHHRRVLDHAARALDGLAHAGVALLPVDRRERTISTYAVGRLIHSYIQMNYPGGPHE